MIARHAGSIINLGSMSGLIVNRPQVKNALGQCQHLLAGIGYASGGYP